MSEEYNNDVDLDTEAGASSADGSPPPSDIGEYEAEVDPETGEPGPVPYARFKESRAEMRELRHRFEDMQLNFANNRKTVEQQQAQIEQYSNLAAQLSQSQQQPRQEDAFEQDDPYADPMEKRIKMLERQSESAQSAAKDRVTQLEQQLEEQRQSQQAAHLERQYKQTVASAVNKFPGANKFEIETMMFQSRKVDKMSVEHFAKRSQESEDERYRSRLKKEGYRTPVKPMMRAGRPGASVKDYGDNLDAAHEAALARLVGHNH